LIHWPIAFEFHGFDLAESMQARFPRTNPADPKSPIALSTIPLSSTWKVRITSFFSKNQMIYFFDKKKN